MFGSGIKRQVRELEADLRHYKQKCEELERLISGKEFEDKLKEQNEAMSLYAQRNLKDLALESNGRFNCRLYVNSKTFHSYIVDSKGYDAKSGYMEPPRWYEITVHIDEAMKDFQFKIVGEYDEVGEPCLNCKTLIENPKWDGYPSDNPKFCDKVCFDQFTSKST